VRHCSISARSAAVALVAAAAFAAAPAASATTQPQPIRDVRIVLTNTGVKFSVATVVRGSLVRFKVRNTATKPRDFFIAGYIVRGLKPGGVRSFQLQFLDRGSFPYYSAAHPGKKYTGSFRVT
jgi:plastocyanin